MNLTIYSDQFSFDKNFTSRYESFLHVFDSTFSLIIFSFIEEHNYHVLTFFDTHRNFNFNSKRESDDKKKFKQ